MKNKKKLVGYICNLYKKKVPCKCRRNSLIWKMKKRDNTIEKLRNKIRELASQLTAVKPENKKLTDEFLMDDKKKMEQRNVMEQEKLTFYEKKLTMLNDSMRQKIFPSIMACTEEFGRYEIILNECITKMNNRAKILDNSNKINQVVPMVKAFSIHKPIISLKRLQLNSSKRILFPKEEIPGTSMRPRSRLDKNRALSDVIAVQRSPVATTSANVDAVLSPTPDVNPDDDDDDGNNYYTNKCKNELVTPDCEKRRRVDDDPLEGTSWMYCDVPNGKIISDKNGNKNNVPLAHSNSKYESFPFPFVTIRKKHISPNGFVRIPSSNSGVEELVQNCEVHENTCNGDDIDANGDFRQINSIGKNLNCQTSCQDNGTIDEQPIEEDDSSHKNESCGRTKEIIKPCFVPIGSVPVPNGGSGRNTKNNTTVDETAKENLPNSSINSDKHSGIKGTGNNSKKRMGKPQSVLKMKLRSFGKPRSDFKMRLRSSKLPR